MLNKYFKMETDLIINLQKFNTWIICHALSAIYIYRNNDLFRTNLERFIITTEVTPGMPVRPLNHILCCFNSSNVLSASLNKAFLYKYITMLLFFVFVFCFLPSRKLNNKIRLRKKIIILISALLVDCSCHTFLRPMKVILLQICKTCFLVVH